MSVAVAGYRHDAFNDLPQVANAASELQAKGGYDMIHEVFGPLFIKHGAEEKFGLGLLHRHFDMAPSERLVEYNSTSTPWHAADAQEFGGTLLSQSWFFADGNQLVPYEFCYSHGDAARVERRSQDATLASIGSFLGELHAMLRARGLDKTLGLRRHPGPDFNGFVEVTVGRANINFDPSVMTPENSNETAWFFDPGFIKRGCRCKCNEISVGHPHAGHREPICKS